MWESTGCVEHLEEIEINGWFSQKHGTNWIRDSPYYCVVYEDETNAFDVGLVSEKDIVFAKEWILYCEVVNGYPRGKWVEDTEISGYLWGGSKIVEECIGNN